MSYVVLIFFFSFPFYSPVFKGDIFLKVYSFTWVIAYVLCDFFWKRLIRLGFFFLARHSSIKEFCGSSGGWLGLWGGEGGRGKWAHGFVGLGGVMGLFFDGRRGRGADGGS